MLSLCNLVFNTGFIKIINLQFYLFCIPASDSVVSVQQPQCHFLHLAEVLFSLVCELRRTWQHIHPLWCLDIYYHHPLLHIIFSYTCGHSFNKFCTCKLTKLQTSGKNVVNDDDDDYNTNLIFLVSHPWLVVYVGSLRNWKFYLKI